MQKIKERREKVSLYLRKNKTEIEIAEILGVSRQTIVRDVAYLKRLSPTWIDGLAKDGFVFEFKLALEKIKENGSRLESLYDETKDGWQKIAIIKAIGQNEKLYIELLGETPTIRALKQAIKTAKESHVQES